MLIWGEKTQALFDLWSIQHVLTGAAVAYIIKNIRFMLASSINIERDIQWSDGVLVLLCVLLWELCEFSFEQGILGEQVQHWFQGTEHFANRIITDPLLVMIGFWLGKRYFIFGSVALVVAIFWITLHIFILPDSLFLQRMI